MKNKIEDVSLFPLLNEYKNIKCQPVVNHLSHQTKIDWYR